MFGKSEEGTFCPIIKDTCKEKKCKFWNDQDCMVANFFESQVIDFINKSEMMENLTAPREQKEVDYSWLEKTSEEDIINEMIEFSLKEFPDEKYLTYSLKNIFWQSKKLDDKYNLPSEMKIKIEKIESKADNVLRKKVEEKEKERLDQIIQNCYDWAKENGSSKLTKSDVNAYIMEVGESLTQASKDILYSKVNMRLKNE